MVTSIVFKDLLVRDKYTRHTCTHTDRLWPRLKQKENPGTTTSAPDANNQNRFKAWVERVCEGRGRGETEHSNNVQIRVKNQKNKSQC